mgnify:FL=1|tara:strand:- start:690 stop:1211 length:522 start_codon:yes stop_codon:yes gene_type:complete
MANFSTSQASNQNYLKAQSFQFKLQKAPKLTYNCQAGPLPSISFDSIPVIGGGGRTVPLHVAALNPVYDDLELRFLVDEKLENWKEIYDWMTSLQNAKEYGDGAKVDGPIDGLSDGSLIILSSAYNPLVQVDFYNLFPKSLSGIEFDSASTDSDPATATVVFAYQSYEVTVLP